jgi:hypothetical protein
MYMETQSELIVDTITQDDLYLLFEIIDNTQVKLKDRAKYESLLELKNKLANILNELQDT